MEMVAALWSNASWDDDKGSRSKAIRSIEDDYSEAIEAVERALGSGYVTEEEKLTESNPFFAATERGLQKVEKRVSDYKKKTGKDLESKDEPDYMKGLDQE